MKGDRYLDRAKGRAGIKRDASRKGGQLNEAEGV
jgi:hypothetical protein